MLVGLLGNLLNRVARGAASMNIVFMGKDLQEYFL